MTTTANIHYTEGAPPGMNWQEAAAVLAHLFFNHPMDTLANLYAFHRQTIPVEYQSHRSSNASTIQSGSSRHDDVPDALTLYNDFLRWAGQHIQSSKNQEKMAKSLPLNGVTADKVLNDSQFERTRENMAEFGRAGKASLLIRDIFRDLTVYAKSNDAHTRLVKVMSRVINTDTLGARGERTVTNGDLQLLRGFNFNKRAAVRDSLYLKCEVTIDRVAGQATVRIPAFVPKVMVMAAKGSTHFRIVAAAATVNFETEDYTYQRATTDELSWDQVEVPASIITLNLPPNSNDAIVVAMGVLFYQRVNGVSYDLKTGQLNAATITAVNKP